MDILIIYRVNTVPFLYFHHLLLPSAQFLYTEPWKGKETFEIGPYFK